MMASQAELLAEAQRRGLAVDPQAALRAEAERRGLIAPDEQQEGALTEAQVLDLVRGGEISPEVARLGVEAIRSGQSITLRDGDLRRIETEGGRFAPQPGVAEQFGLGVGLGARTIGRGVGLIGEETLAPDVAFKESLTDPMFAASIGEVTGEALPFVPAAFIGPAAGLSSLAARMLFGAGLGATEAGLIARGQGGDAADIVTGASIGGGIGAGAEAVIPFFGRAASKVFRKLKRQPKGPLLTEAGTPTPEFQAALDETGTSFDDLTKEAVDSLKAAQPGTDPAQAARAARFEAQDIPATVGDITQGMVPQTAEARAVSLATGEAGEPLRQLRLQQSEAFKARVGSLVDSLGVPESTGASLKTALEGRKKLLTKDKNALYKSVADASPEAANFPILTTTIEDALPEPAKLRRLSRIAGSQIEGVKDLLVEFGIDKSDEALEKFAKEGGEVTPLTLANFDEFRQALGQLERADTTGSIGVMTGPIREALDAEASLIGDAVKAAGVTDEGIVRTLEAARATVRTLKTEFSPQAITGRLIGTKRDGVTPVIEASKAGKELLKPGAPIENLQRTLQSLRDAGTVGAQAVGDLRASVVLDALEAGLKAPSRKTAGIETIGGNQFAKHLDALGNDKLDLLFRGDKASFDALQNLRQTALDISPAAAATPRGSAPVLLDLFNRFKIFPGVAAVRDISNLVITAGADERAVKKALNAKPEVVEQISKLRKSYPSLLTAIGVPATLEITDE